MQSTLQSRQPHNCVAVSFDTAKIESRKAGHERSCSFGGRRSIQLCHGDKSLDFRLSQVVRSSVNKRELQ